LCSSRHAPDKHPAAVALMILVLLHRSDEGDTTMAEGNGMTAREAASNVMALEPA